MNLILRIDLQAGVCTPGDPESSFHEPAIALRWLDVARERGYRYHFFQSIESIAAFPCLTDRILNEGHCVDLLISHLESPLRESTNGHQFAGFACNDELSDNIPPWAQWIVSGGFNLELRRVVNGRIQAKAIPSIECIVLSRNPSNETVQRIEEKLKAGCTLITARDASGPQHQDS